MNKVILMGRLTRDPEVRYSQGETPLAIARYSLAVDRRQSRNNPDGQTADFINCVAFGRQGEFAEKYLNKDGVKVYTTEVVVEDHEFAESKSSQQGGDNGGYVPMQNTAPVAAGEGFMNIPDGIEELPFN